MKKMIASALMLACVFSACAETFDKSIPISKKKGMSTYYIEGYIDGLGTAQLLVDTGSSYTAIGQGAFSLLEQHGQVLYVKNLRGIMADGSQRVVSVYRIPAIKLGKDCYVRDVEVAVLPHNTRPLLGLSVLRKVSPFAFSLNDSPMLMLSNCQSTPALQIK